MRVVRQEILGIVLFRVCAEAMNDIAQARVLVQKMQTQSLRMRLQTSGWLLCLNGRVHCIHAAEDSTLETSATAEEVFARSTPPASKANKPCIATPHSEQMLKS